MPEAVLASERSVAPVRGRKRQLAGILFLGFLWFILCRHLSNEWSANEQYSYGWFVPFFAAFLFWLRWEDRPEQSSNVEHRTSNIEHRTGSEEAGRAAKVESGKSKLESPRSAARSFLLPTFYFLLCFSLLPLRLFEVGNPDWRPLGWIHAALVVALTLLFIWRVGGAPWLRHFAFPVAFIFVAVPWVSPIETPIVQGLMRIVATIATETLALFGIPAQLEGSVIRISSGVVGVNEACSGVRSLQTSLMIGLLFGELKRFSLARRLALIAAAGGIAFVANCARAFFLVWIAARQGVGAVEQWHDVAGYAILGAVFLGTIGVAALLSPKVMSGKAQVEIPQSAVRNPQSAFLLSTFSFLLPLLWLLVVEGAVEFWYRSHERDLVSTPTWNVRWPEDVPGFREVKISEDARSTLRYDEGRQAVWPLVLENTTAAPVGAAVAGTSSMFFFRWEPGTTSILRARAHRPDVCLPNTGWRVTHDHGVRSYPVTDNVAMPFRHFTFARPIAENRELSAHAFFCQREDRIPAREAGQFDLTAGALSNWSREDRLRVVREGLRNQGQQVLEVVLITSVPLDGDAAQSQFAKLVPEIVEIGGK